MVGIGRGWGRYWELASIRLFGEGQGIGQSGLLLRLSAGCNIYFVILFLVCTSGVAIVIGLAWVERLVERLFLFPWSFGSVWWFGRWSLGIGFRSFSA